MLTHFIIKKIHRLNVIISSVYGHLTDFSNKKYFMYAGPIIIVFPGNCGHDIWGRRPYKGSPEGMFWNTSVWLGQGSICTQLSYAASITAVSYFLLTQPDKCIWSVSNI